MVSKESLEHVIRQDKKDPGELLRLKYRLSVSITRLLRRKQSKKDERKNNLCTVLGEREKRKRNFCNIIKSELNYPNPNPYYKTIFYFIFHNFWKELYFKYSRYSWTSRFWSRDFRYPEIKWRYWNCCGCC
eukprot:maker-scaffold_67-snap-gene-0.13-mRNA-1 protein AED:0.64 eAED:0.91 QI:0/0/0/0.66/0/0/3/0/130